MNSQVARLSRRKVIWGGLVATGFVGIGGLTLALQKPRPPKSVPRLAVLDASEYAILVALAERLCPKLDADAPGATALGVAQTIDQLLVQSDATAQKAIKGALTLFDNALGGALTGERLVPFTHLSSADQERLLFAWRDSSIGMRRTVFRALAGVVWAVYWGNPSTWKRIGYGGPPDGGALRAAYASNLVDLDALRATPLAHGT
jgi:Gluconate 2-dehydrogenase subunit 3